MTLPNRLSGSNCHKNAPWDVYLGFNYYFTKDDFLGMSDTLNIQRNLPVIIKNRTLMNSSTVIFT